MTRTDFTALKKTPGRIAVVAGAGRLPELLALKLKESGRSPFIANLMQADQPWITAYDHADIVLGKPSDFIHTLHQSNVTELVMAGSVYKRPRLAQVLSDWRMYGEFVRIFKAWFSGDDGLLRIAINFFERKGFAVRGVHEFMPELLAPEGTLTKHQPVQQDLADISIAIKAAKEHGRLDLGQAVVARAGAIVAKEGKGGTAAMLSTMSPHEHSARGVLVKWSKPGQELRVDLPTIGTDTITQIKNAGLAGIVVEAGHAIILDREDVVRLADEHGLFVLGAKG
jgi:UDP-2,3-diacylglucosamine hydrolase